MHAIFKETEIIWQVLSKPSARLNMPLLSFRALLMGKFTTSLYKT